MPKPERTLEYRKDSTQEQYLQNINTLLAPLETDQIGCFDKPQLPNLFIIGVPRSGTTLLAQVLAQTGMFSYINNFVARFWLAPYIGMLIDNSLNMGGTVPSQIFSSNYGVTEGWSGPHEFGYFWSRWFHFEETNRERELANTADRKTLQREIAALESVHNKPLFFKNLNCGHRIHLLAQLFEKSIFLLCQRHPLYNMQSLLLGREKVYGDKNVWFSLRPEEYPDLLFLSPYEQVAGQVYFNLRAIQRSLSTLPSWRYLEVQYDELCSKPRKEVAKIVEIMSQQGVQLSWEPKAIPEKFESTDKQQLSSEEFQKLSQAAKKYF